MFELERLLRQFKHITTPEHYADWLRIFSEMIVHTRKEKPDDLLLSARPNEDPCVTQYRLDNFRPITYAAMIKAFDRLFRIFNQLNFSWSAPDKVKEYVAENKFYKHSFSQFMSQNVLKTGIDDPNALLVWLPDGEGLTDQTKSVSPKPFIVESRFIKMFDEDVLIYEHHIDIAKYKDIVENDPQEYKSYVVITKQEYGFFFYYESEAKDYYQPIYTMTGFDELPVVVLGGIDCGGYWESFFSPFLAFGNESISKFSDWQGVTVMCGFPQIEELEIECDAKGCVGGWTGTPHNDKTMCRSCFGTGTKQNKGPFGVVKRRLPEDGEEDKNLDTRARRFNSPDIDIIEQMDKAWKSLLTMGEDALHLVYTKEAQSGIAKDIDREDGDSTIQKISDRHFDIHWYYSLKYIGMYLMPGKFPKNSITISKPINFRLRTISDLLEEIATLKEKNAPIMIILNVVKELFYKRFSTDQISKKIFDVIFENDPLSVYSVEEASTLILENAIDPEQMTNNLYLFQTLLKMSKELGMTSEKFVLIPNDELYKMALEKIKPFYQKEIKPLNPLLPAPPAPGEDDDEETEED